MKRILLLTLWLTASSMLFTVSELNAARVSKEAPRLFLTGNIGFSLAERIDANETGCVRGKIFFDAPILSAELRLLGGWSLGLRAGEGLLLRIEGTGDVSNAEPVSAGFTWGAFSRFYFPLSLPGSADHSSLFVGMALQAVSGKFSQGSQAGQWGMELGQRRLYRSGLVFDYHLSFGSLVEGTPKTPVPESIFLSLHFSFGLAVF